MPAPIRVPGVASTAIRDLISGPGKTATVLGTSSHAIWILLGDDVVVASDQDATRLPNGVEVAVEADTDVFGSVQYGSFASIDGGCITVGGLTIDVVRWWNPRPALPHVSSSALATAISDLPSVVPAVDGERLRAALTARSPEALLEAAAVLVGLGPGLTPEGDDYLAGALAAARTLGVAVRDTDTIRMLDGALTPMSRLARERTTAFSAALIEHAIRGNVAAPAGAFLRSLVGRGDVRHSHRLLLEVGHSSGPALAAGVVLGAQALSTSTSRPVGGTR